MSSRSSKKNKVGRVSLAGSAPAGSSTPPAAPLLSPRGKKLIVAGALVVIAGFFILSKTDPAGQNWASVVSPLLLVLGYVLIGFGLVRPARESTEKPSSSSSSAL